jgi:uncharacterized protein YggU (UPF0235/DUF167 family)
LSVEFDVRVIPRSSQEKVEQQPDGSLKIWVRASPTDGQANEAVCVLLAKALSVSKGSIEIVRGHSGRSKRVRASGIEPSEAQKRLSSKG